jgi:hypothetical protein
MGRSNGVAARAAGVVSWLAVGVGAAGASGNPWADLVVGYQAGVGVSAGYDDPARALGSPTRVTGEGFGFPGSVTPFASAFEPDELVSIGEGGSLTVRFERAVRDDARNPFGVDLLIFGNAFFTASSFTDPDPVATGVFADGGVVELSADGLTWVTLTGVGADSGLPTLGFADETSVFGGPAGSVRTDFTRPVDPAFDPIGRTFSEIVAAYDGAGGGLGIDLAAWGLTSVSFVRISTAVGSGVTVEIDALSDVGAVPGPGVVAMVALGAVGASRRRRA